MRLRALAILCVFAALTAGCGGKDTPAKAEPTEPESSSSAPSPSESPTELPAESASSSSSAPMTVSLSTSCQLLFNFDPSPMTKAIKLVNKGNMDSDDLVAAVDLKDTFDHIAANAISAIQPFVLAISAAMQDVLDLFATGQNGTRDLQDFRAAGLELIDRCSAFIE